MDFSAQLGFLKALSFDHAIMSQPSLWVMNEYGTQLSVGFRVFKCLDSVGFLYEGMIQLKSSWEKRGDHYISGDVLEF